MTTDMTTISDIERMAKYAVDSGLFGVKTIPQAASLMLLCQAKGMHPMEAMEEYHIIQGRHTMKSERMLAKFQQAGGKVAWKDLNDQRAEATFSHPQGGSVTIDWDIERAKRAGIYGKDNWKNYARAMLRSRVVSEGVKSVLPGVTSGVYTPEEAIDIPAEDRIERDVTPAKPATGVAALSARIAELAPEPEPTTLPDADATLATVNDQILAQLRDVALEGSEKLKAAWNGLPDAMKTELRPNLASLKKAAADADKTPHQIDIEQAEARG